MSDYKKQLIEEVVLKIFYTAKYNPKTGKYEKNMDPKFVTNDLDEEYFIIDELNPYITQNSISLAAFPIIQRMVESIKDKYDDLVLVFYDDHENYRRLPYIKGIRKETDQEFEKRVSRLKAIKEKANATKDKNKKTKEERKVEEELALLKKLKEKYEV